MAFSDPSWIETAQRQINDAAELLDSVDWSGKRVLDIGCWWGWFVRYARKRGARVVGLDCQASRVQDAVEYLQGSQDLCVADGLHLPFPADAFDVAVSIHVLEHVLPEDRMIGEYRRILKPGGTLLISVPNDRSLGILPYRPLRLLIRGRLGSKLPPAVHRYVRSLSYSDLSHHREYTRRSIGRALQASGFQVEQVWHHGIDLPYPLKGRLSQSVRQQISLSLGKAVPPVLRTSVSVKARNLAKESG